VKESKMKITFEDGQTLNLGCGFAGGIMADFTSAPVGLYVGSLDLADTSLSLTHLLRAVIKTNIEEQNMNFDQSKTFIEFCLKEAIKREKDNKNIDNATLQQHETVLKMRKDFS
jgi:hypothetical protein